MFWKKKSLAGRTGPINIPGWVGAHVVNEMQKMPQTTDHWVKYKGVVRPQPDGSGKFDIRVFDEWDTNTRGLKVTDYSFLDAHPELIQFEGWFNEATKKAEIKATLVAQSGK